MVCDGAKTFLKLFSLRGGGHYLPHGFKFSPFPLSFQSIVLMMVSTVHFGFGGLSDVPL